MRLIGPLLFVFVGIGVTLLLRPLLGRGAPGLRFSLVIGVVGALLGLWLRDVFDLVLGDPFYGAIVAAAAGAGLLTLAISVGLRRVRAPGALSRSDRDSDSSR